MNYTFFKKEKKIIKKQIAKLCFICFHLGGEAKVKRI